MKRVLFLLFSLCCAFAASAEKFVIYDENGDTQAKFSANPGDGFKLQEGSICIFDSADQDGTLTGVVVPAGWHGEVKPDDDAEDVPPVKTIIDPNKADSGENEIYTAWTLDGRYISPARIKSGEMDGSYVEFKGFGNGKKIKVLLLNR